MSPWPPAPAADRLWMLWGWGVPQAGCAVLVQHQSRETPAAPSTLAPRGPTRESHLAAGEPGFPSQALPALGMGALERAGGSSPLPAPLSVALYLRCVPSTAFPGALGQHRSWSWGPGRGYSTYSPPSACFMTKSMVPVCVCG